MKKIINFVPASLLTVLFIIWTILVKTVDVQYINNIGYLGFYNFNSQINSQIVQFGRTNIFDKLTDIGMYLSFAIVLIFVVIGLVQWIKRKSLKKVSPIIFILLATYIVTVFMYLIFEIVKINYSPISTPDELKASYPSTHVLLFIVFLLTGVIALFEFIQINKIVKILSISFATLISILFAATRLLSGQHYFSDIVGSIFLASSIIALFIGLKLQFLKVEN